MTEELPKVLFAWTNTELNAAIEDGYEQLILDNRAELTLSEFNEGTIPKLVVWGKDVAHGFRFSIRCDVSFSEAFPETGPWRAQALARRPFSQQIEDDGSWPKNVS